MVYLLMISLQNHGQRTSRAELLLINCLSTQNRSMRAIAWFQQLGAYNLSLIGGAD